MEELQYISGFGSHVETEALKGALPVGQNSPKSELWVVCRAAVGHGLHRAKGEESAFLAVPHSTTSGA